MGQTPTAAELEVIEAMIKDGATAGQIAAELKRTRNSVMGIIFRYMKPKGVRLRQRTVEFVIERSRIVTAERQRQKAELRARLLATQAEAGPIVYGKLFKRTSKRLMELKKGDCRFPVREVPGMEGRYLFCAAPALRDRYYCREHWELCNKAVRRAA